jgi:hypothetical protein
MVFKSINKSNVKISNGILTMKHNRLRILALVLAIFCLPAVAALPCSGTAVYVDGNRPDDNGEGCDWTTAFKTLETAISKVNTDAQYANIKEIRVAEGTYTPSVTLQLNHNVSMYGGYPASGGARDPKLNQTKITGYIVIGSATFTEKLVFDGIYMQAGSQFIIGSPAKDVEVKMCSFVGCDVIFNDLSSLKINECEFQGLRQEITIVNISGDMELMNCTMKDIKNGMKGTLIASGIAGKTTIQSCTFFSNATKYTAPYNYGGAINLGILGSNTYIFNCKFFSNVGETGGAIALLNSSAGKTVSIVNCLVHENTASVGGGAIYVAGSGGTLNIINSTLANNTTGGTDGGGAILINNSTAIVNVENSILWGNTVPTGTPESKMQIGYGTFTGTINAKYSCLQDATPGDGTLYTSPNGVVLKIIDKDPLFAKPNAHSISNYHLNALSPCIMQGNPAPDLSAFPTDGSSTKIDLDGNNRWPDTRYPITMGPYEVNGYQGTILYVDENSTATNEDGFSWGTAFKSLDDVLHKLHPAYPDEYWKYTKISTIYIAKGDYNISTTLNYRVDLIGGFPSGGGVRDPASNETNISGSIEVSDFGKKIVKNEIIIDGLSFPSGGIGCGGGLIVEANVKISKCTFLNSINISISHFKNLTIEYCKFSNSLNSFFIGRTSLAMQRVKFNDCSFSNIVSTNSLVGIYMGVRDISFTNCDFKNNSCSNVYYSERTDIADFQNCHFQGNQTTGELLFFNTSGSGPAHFVNCLFEGNKSNATLRFCDDYGKLNLLNCTFANNLSNNIYGGSAVLFNTFYNDWDVKIENTIMWGNSAPSCSDQNKVNISYSGITSSTLNITNSCIQDADPNDGITYTSPNGTTKYVIDDNPLFISTGSWSGSTWTPGNYHTSPGSPCWMTGNPETNIKLFPVNASGEAIDLARNPRKLPNFPIDMGAYNDANSTRLFIVLVKSGQGTVTPDHSVNLLYGASQTFTFTPAATWKVGDVLIDGVSNSAAIKNGTYTFSTLTTHHSITVKFEKIYYDFKVTVVNDADGTAVRGATVAVRGEISYDKTTDRDGKTNLSLPAGPYTLTVSHPCYASREVTVSYPFTDQTIRLVKNPINTPVAHFSLISGQQTFSPLDAERGPDKYISTTVVLDNCPVKTEQIELDGYGTLDACYPAVTITGYEWLKEGVRISTNKKITHILTDGPAKNFTFKVTYSNGAVAEYSQYLILRECEPDFRSQNYIIAQEEWDGNLFSVGDAISSFKDGIGDIHYSLNLFIKCQCKVTGTITWSWQVKQKNENEEVVYEYTKLTGTGMPDVLPLEIQEITTRGYGIYDAEFAMMVDGETVLNLTKRISVIFPQMIMLCPPYGCTSTYDYCNPFNYQIPSEKLDVRQDYVAANETFSQTLNAMGSGIAAENSQGFMDMSTFKSVRAAGDFTIVTKIENEASLGALLQAGLMAREDNFMFGRMCFLGKIDGKVHLIIRDKARKDVAPYKITGRDDHDCLRIDRVNGKYSFYTAQSVGGVCPSTWGSKIEIAGCSDFAIWEGPAEVGVSLAGSPVLAGVTFSNIHITENEHKLSEPATIVNTVFAQGNLVSNWSFENVMPFFSPQTANYIVRKEKYNDGVSDINAYEGYYFCRIKDKTDNTTTLTSKPMPADVALGGKSTAEFKLYCMTRIIGTIPGTVHPTIVVTNSSGSTTRVDLTAYTGSTSWTFYEAKIDLTTVTGAVSFSLELVDKTNTWSSGSIDFDNIRIEPVFKELVASSTSDGPVTTITYADGLEQTFQTIKPHGDKDIVIATILDDEGRVERVLPAFVTENQLHKVKTDPVSEMQQYFSTQDESRVYSSGTRNIAERPSFDNLRLNCGATIFERSPVNRPRLKLGFLSSGNDDIGYEYLYGDASGNPNDRVHFLQNNTYTHIGRYRISQSRVVEEYYNPLKQLVKTVTKGPTSAEDLISTKKVDALGLIWETTSPLGNESSDPDDYTTTFLFNTSGKVIHSNDHDAGMKEILYDRAGNARFVRDGNLRAKNQFIENQYDRFNRLLKVLIITGAERFTQENAYNGWADEDKAEDDFAELVVYNGYDRNFRGLWNVKSEEINNSMGKLVYTNTWDKKGSNRKDVRRFFSYDYRGNVEKEWLVVSGQSLQQITYTYNTGNQLVKKVTKGKEPANGSGKEGKEIVKTEKYQYDELNRIKSVWSEDKKVAEYSYYSDGKVQYKDFGGETSDKVLSQSIAFRYDVLGRLTLQRQELYDPVNKNYGANGYRQNLNYECYGNIESQDYTIPGSEAWRKSMYQYDHFNRLTRASFSVDGGAADESLDGAYSYDKDGAITTLAHGPLAGTPADHGTYTYETGTHRLKSISKPVITGGKDRSNAANYLYDANGNIIEDKSTARRISYDYRNMPETITQYTDNTFTKIKFVTEFIYDANGTRVAKLNRKAP